MARTKIKTARFLSRVIDIAVLSACLSVTFRYYIETAERIILSSIYRSFVSTKRLWGRV